MSSRRFRPGSLLAIVAPVASLMFTSLLLASLLLASLVLATPSASAEPQSIPKAEARAIAVVEAAGFEPDRVPELIDVSVELETWILAIEQDADTKLLSVEVVEAHLRDNQLSRLGLWLQLELAHQAVDGAELTREVVELRNELPAMEAEWLEAQDTWTVLEARAEQATDAHAEALEALMIAWNLRHEVGASFANFADDPVAPTPQDGWTPLLTEWTRALLRDAQFAVDALTPIEDEIPSQAHKVDVTELNREQSMVWPAIGAVNSGFGMRVHPVWGGYRMHSGVDIDADHNDDVTSIADGVVVRAGWNGGYGNTVEVDHGDGITSLYAHLSEINVSLDDRVALGDVIGLVGATGTVTDAHLHFETRLNGESVDPLLYLP